MPYHGEKRSDRPSILRVPVFYEQLDKLREELRVWGDCDGTTNTSGMGVSVSSHHPPWVASPLSIILNGHHVEANLLP